MTDFTPEWIIVHCVATPPHMTQVDAAWVDTLHRRKGWLMNGYHEIITRPHEGQPAQRQNHALGFRTRPITRPGAHVGGSGRVWNQKTIGISLAGGVDAQGNPEDNFTGDQITLLLEAIREYQEQFNIPDENVIGHRDLIRMTNSSPKACPCMSVRALMAGKDGRFGGSFNFRRKAAGGDKLAIPETHRVRRAESLWGISKAYGISVSDLANWNSIKDVDSLRSGALLSLRPPY